MTTPIYQVDAFTARPFAGNPAAVVPLGEPREAGWMQAVAREMNLSETAFVTAADGAFSLRWFTPRVEVRLCGHATLATAHVLWSEGMLPVDHEARFHTLSGLLTASRRDDLIELDFPARRLSEVGRDQDLAAALGVEPIFIGRELDDRLVLVASADEVRTAAPDFTRLGRVDARGVVVTAASDDPACDFVSRFFAPAVGIDEDPVTGSAHCALGPFWAERLGRNELRGFQASARGGVVRVRVAGDRVVLGGHAVTVLRGELLV